MDDRLALRGEALFEGTNLVAPLVPQEIFHLRALVPPAAFATRRRSDAENPKPRHWFLARGKTPDRAQGVWERRGERRV
jgi:hypothetical protein